MLQTQMKKRVSIFSVSLIVTIVAMFVECDVYFPDKIKIFDGESLEIREGSPYTVDVLASNTVAESGGYNAQVKLFGVIPVKSVEVDILPCEKIIPGGKTIGIKLFTHGLMCVKTEKITGENGNALDAKKDCDIKNADMIISVNGVALHTVEQFGEIVSSSDGSTLELGVLRNGKTYKKKITPIKTKDGYKLGIWVRDSTAGIGTLTFIDKNSNLYGALGHPITDIDTGSLMPVSQGSIAVATITDVKKGKRGEPGELQGIFDQSRADIGVIYTNTERGIFGELDETYIEDITNAPLPVASKSQVKTGKAEILANIDDNKVERFEVEIVKIMKYAQNDKNMVIHVKDKRLIEKTGGIVQGMSGSPIIQDGKIIGAVTHVFVNDPTRGYGIFIENMLSETMKN